MSNLAIQIEDLAFSYPGRSGLCLSHFNLEIFAGERFGLFGPNGAGKTTLMHLMTGLLHYKQGSIRLLGRDVKKHNKAFNSLFGLVPQDFSFYPELSAVENLSFFGAWSGLNGMEIKKRTDELLETLGLNDYRSMPVGKFSGGMKRRINLAIAVMHHPQILFLDEPTVGVDVQTRHAIIAYLKYLNEKGTTLVYTSHQLNEAEELCERIAMIDEGNIIAIDNLENLLNHHQQEGLEGLFLTLTGKAYRD
ncbi:MAG: ABC transporter ATP-binding protein [Bacteroidetes bacterium]|nr:MAG: ABC transporter ATP-binding protein [Bacteroidota bacterium]